MQMFRGGIENIETLVNVWTDPTKVFRAGLVGALNGTPPPDWQYLSEFTAVNPLVPDASLPTLATRAVETWNAPTNRVNFRWTNKLSFGNPAASQAFVGAVIYRDSGAPSTSQLWFLDDQGPGFPGITQGGLVQYGVDGSGNTAGYLEAIVGSATPLAGAALDLLDSSQIWLSSAVFKLRLVVSTGVVVGNPDWVTLQDAITAGVVFATGSSDVVIAQADRSKAWDANSDWFEFAADPPLPYTFPSVPVGQTIAAVLMFRDTGVPSTSRVWHWDAGFAPAAATGGDFVYGSGLREVLTKVIL